MKTTSRTEKIYAFNNAPRCGARTKTNNGQPCRCPAVRGKSRCRIHGGAKGSGAPKGNHNALKHGANTMEAKKIKLMIKNALKETKFFLGSQY